MDDRELSDFLDAALGAHRHASGRTGTIVTDVGLGPVRARVRACGAPIHERLTNMLVAAPEPHAADIPCVDILAFDSATSGVPMPAPPWTPDDYRPGTGIHGLRDGRFLASYMVDHAALTFYDRERRVGIYWAADAPALAAWQEAAPLRSMLRWIAVDHGADIVHAAAIGHGGDGVLVLGAQGAGKSTTSLACMEAGSDFVADDFCLLLGGPGDERRATPLTHTARATEDTLTLVPGLRARITNHGAPADHKAEVTVADRLTDGLRIVALATPERAPRTGSARQVHRTAFVRSVLAGTVGVFPGLEAGALGLLVRLTEELPCFVLPIGPDLAGARTVVDDVVERTRAVAA